MMFLKGGILTMPLKGNEKNVSAKNFYNPKAIGFGNRLAGTKRFWLQIDAEHYENYEKKSILKVDR